MVKSKTETKWLILKRFHHVIEVLLHILGLIGFTNYDNGLLHSVQNKNRFEAFSAVLLFFAKMR
jgi:hypothetical protein